MPLNEPYLQLDEMRRCLERQMYTKGFHSLISCLPADLIDCAGGHFGMRNVMFADTDNKRCLDMKSPC